MPALERPDGAAIHWDEAGEDGPLVLLCNTFNLTRADRLVRRLAGSRRVLTYEPRGVGRSTRQGPYDLATGVADLAALLEAVGPADVALGIGDGAHRGMRTADSRPDLLNRVVVTSAGLGRPGGRGDQVSGFSGSDEVLGALISLMRRDYRAGLRSMVSGSGPETPAEERERVEQLVATVPQEATVGYLEQWMEADSASAARNLGDRLTILAYPGNSWFPLSVYETMRDHLPEASYELVDDGPMNRPDLAADALLRASAPARG